MENTNIDNSLKIFFILLIVLSAIVNILLVTIENGVLYLALMWVPGFSAIIAKLYEVIANEGRFNIKSIFSGLGFKLCSVKFILLGCLLPLIYLLVPYIVYWSTYPKDFAYNGVALNLILSDCLPITILGIFMNIPSAIGEETGWRGYLVPALNKKYGYKKALFISSIIWCLWHMPIMLFDGYMEGTAWYYKYPAFILCILPVGIIAGLLAIESKSVLPSTFLHAAHNKYDQSVFSIITRKTDKLMYYASETGMFTILCAWIIAIVMLIRYTRRNISN